MKKDGLLLVGDGEPQLELFLAALGQAAPALRRLHPPEHHRHDDHVIIIIILIIITHLTIIVMIIRFGTPWS